MTPLSSSSLSPVAAAASVDDVLRGLESSLDTVWILTATALIFFMQLGFAFLEGGAVRSKNTVNVVMKNYTDMCVGGLAFAAVGYGLMFGSNPSGWLGTDKFLMLGMDQKDLAFVLFQMMFAATAATIVSGALAERIRYRPYVLCSVIVTALIYTTFGSWAWGSHHDGTMGWLKSLGFVDFAGSTVVHSIGGWCALAGIVVLGPRLGRFSRKGEARFIPGHSLPFVAAGGFILWLGWFGFNGGSTLKADASLGAVVFSTHLAGVAGVSTALAFLFLMRRPVLLTHTVNGGLGGLVAITASANIATPITAVVTGAVGGLVVMLGMGLMERFQLDDPVGAVPVHGMAGAWGTLSVALLNPNGFDSRLLLAQLAGIGVALVWGFGTGFVLFKLADRLIGLRVSSIEEQRGLDFAEHYEVGYPEFLQDQLHAGRG